MKCYNLRCENENSKLKGTKGYFCRSCILGKDPFVFKCVQCGNTFEKYELNSQLPKFCQISCKYKYGNHYVRKVKNNFVKKETIQDKMENLVTNYNLTKEELIERSGCSPKSFKQIIHKLRDKHNIICLSGYYINIKDVE